jgi:spermidine/putrescine transport system permease protein
VQLDLGRLVSVVLGTLVGLALGKYRFRGLGTANLVQFATISAPDIVMASSPCGCRSGCRRSSWRT